MENRKYKLTNTTIRYMGRKLYRIKALKDFSDVKKGDLGGWVFSKNNLSQEGDCWIYNNAKCMDNARVCDDSCMYDYSVMRNNSCMYDSSRMYDHSIMYDHSEMHDNSEMHGYSIMLEYSIMHEHSKMYNHSEMHGYSEMFGYSEMHDYGKMFDNSRMYDYSKMYNDSSIYDVSAMFGSSRMFGSSKLKDKEKLHGKLVSKVDNFININNKKGRMVTGVLKEGNILYNVGCQEEITKEEFIDRIYNDDGGIEKHPYRKEYLKIIDIIEIYLSK